MKVLFSGYTKLTANVTQLHVCCVKVQDYLSVKHGFERYKTKFKLITI